MAILSRTARITLLLVIDVMFFFVELIVGYAVGSLALVADSFHMLNDVMSLVVALYAIKLAEQQSDHRYTYGWHRAEILAALINGVFLLALCFSIFLEAIGRFFENTEISNAKLVVIVGSLGLASNIVGLFLFHEHGHSHDHGHQHGQDESHESEILTIEAASAVEESEPTSPVSSPRDVKRVASPVRDRADSVPSLYGHPAATRASLVQAANDMAYSQARSPSPVRHLSRTRHNISRPSSSLDEAMSHVAEDSRHLSDVEDVPEPNDEDLPHERTALLSHQGSSSPAPSTVVPKSHGSDHGHGHGHGHSHGSMNMQAVLLHVLGDALGNVGVIAAGLVIWLTEWKYKYYFDPLISLIITIIIFSSALPLVRSASFILLQGVPTSVSLDEVRAEILSVEGVLSVHELHVWQLSESKVVASVHVTASRDVDFMITASAIRERLHRLGIHSSTIQPEYHGRNAPPDQALKTNADTSCLIPCPPDQSCNAENACCPPAQGTSNV